MLIDAKPKLKQDIYNILQKSMYEAYMTSFNKDVDVDDVIKNRIQKEMDSSAKKYSIKFAEEACEPLATAIYEFVKQIGITTSPTGLTSVSGGPVGGIIQPGEHRIS